MEQPGWHSVHRQDAVPQLQARTLSRATRGQRVDKPPEQLDPGSLTPGQDRGRFPWQEVILHARCEFLDRRLPPRRRVEGHGVLVQAQRTPPHACPHAAVRRLGQIPDIAGSVSLHREDADPGPLSESADSRVCARIHTAVVSHVERLHLPSLQAVLLGVGRPIHPVVDADAVFHPEPHPALFVLGQAPDPQAPQLGEYGPAPGLQHGIGMHGLVGLDGLEGWRNDEQEEEERKTEEKRQRSIGN